MTVTHRKQDGRCLFSPKKAFAGLIWIFANTIISSVVQMTFMQQTVSAGVLAAVCLKCNDLTLGCFF